MDTPNTQIICGDCLEVLRTLPDNSVDACVTDPPYGLSFMGKKWDCEVPSVDVWREVWRVLKPGAHLLSFFGTRTYHRGVVAVEDGGFEIRDQIGWCFGSGFPKSLDVSKAIDKAAGVEREVVGSRTSAYGTETATGERVSRKKGGAGLWVGAEAKDILTRSNAPATDAAREWQGWGTALKPAWEPIVVARKPFDGTVAANVLAHGVGAINVDGCRISAETETIQRGSLDATYTNADEGYQRKNRSMMTHKPLERSGPAHEQGRWPANIIHDGSDEVLAGFPETKSGKPGIRRQPHETGSMSGTLGILGRQETGFGDSGSAARFFYAAKASKAERDEGMVGAPRSAAECVERKDGSDGMNSPRAGAGRTSGTRNHHPTVKPQSLMRYLCRLVTPSGGVVLDPFMGSGSTGVGALAEGFRFIGIEREAEYFAIARQRLDHATRQDGLFAETL